MAEEISTSTLKKRRKGQRMTATQRESAQTLFLVAFARAANVTEACRVATVDRGTFYDWLEKDEAFSFRYHQAEQIANDGIRAEIYRRAIEGVEEPLIYKGGIVYELDEQNKKRMVTMRKYSDTLLIFLAKARMPEFRDKQHIDLTAQITTLAENAKAELLADLAATLAADEAQE